MQKAHDLKPVVMVGKNGLTDALSEAVDEALSAHELIKVKFQDYREARHSIALRLAEFTDSTLVTIIGNIAIFFRAHEDPERQRIRLPGTRV